MTTGFGAAHLTRRGLRYYRREHLLVAAATAVAVAVLVGALVVGDSVRGSLRAAFTERLGATDYAILPTHAFADDPDSGLAARLAARDEYRARFEPAVPIYRLAGTVVAPDGGTVPVTVLGVDGRFFAFHGLEDVIDPGTARISSGVRRLGFAPGDALLIQVGGYEDIAAASLFGEKESTGIMLRRDVAGWPAPAPGVASGDFALFPGQGATRAVFLPLDDLRRFVELEGRGRRDDQAPLRANALLVRNTARDAATAGNAAALEDVLAEVSSLDDRGLRLSDGASGGSVLESRSLVLDDRVVEGALAAAGQRGAEAAPVLTYLATGIRAAGRETPYSLVSGIPAPLLPGGDAREDEEDVLYPGPWLAEDLALHPGDPLELSFLVWEEEGRFHSESASFVAGATVPGDGLFLDVTLAPEFPGVSDSTRMGDWDPPFPVDLSRIRERDEEYWEEHRTLPKAFVPLGTARRLWTMRQGSATSVRFGADVGGGPGSDLHEALLAALPPEDFGLVPLPVRQQGLEASRGATDFGVYFLYFSYFLLVSAFVLLALLYRLGVERRLREIGLLLACGWSPRRVSRSLLSEAAVVASAGAVAGAFAGLAYATGMIGLLSGVWEGAVAGTLSTNTGDGSAGAALGVSVRWSSILAGAFSGVVMAMGAAWWTLRKLVRCSPRGLLAGNPTEDLGSWPLVAPAGSPGAGSRRFAVVTGASGLLLLGLAVTGTIPEAAGFFGAGAALLATAFLVAWARLKGLADPARRAAPTSGSGLRGLAFRATTFRPGRSLAAMILIAFAAFTLVAVEAFRKQPDPGTLPAGAGGFVSITETVFGSPWDPRDPEGHQALNLLPPDLSGVRIQPLRLAGDEDASCLNLYRPSRPRVIGIPRALAEENRFPFGAHLGESPEEIENPWRLLWRDRESGEAIPVIGDQNSMTYVLKWPVGEERAFPIGPGGALVRLRLVGTLWDSLFQGELLMAEEDLLAALPAPDGYRLFLTEPEEIPRGEEALAAAEAFAGNMVTGALADYGAVSTPTRARLDEFHRVENTYLSTFQALGGLGLLLGTFGLGAVLLRNADERRQEWALLSAAGYRRRDFAKLGFWENALLLTGGLAAGSIAAVIAILPVLGQRSAGGSLTLLALLLLGVLTFGLGAGALAARTAANRPILESLRAG